jgi:hypothetical protein
MGLKELQEIKNNADKTPKYKIVGGVKKYSIQKVSAKKKALNNGSMYSEDKELENWFLERRKEMCTYCAECGKHTFKNNDKQYKWSICHLLPKSIFESVATHKDNCIFLCWLHHQELDSSWDNAKKMFIWDEVKYKVQSFLHLVTEKHKILEHFK